MSKLQLNKKAGLYYRLSKDDERIGESLSIGNQKLIIERCARENGFEIVDEYDVTDESKPDDTIDTDNSNDSTENNGNNRIIWVVIGAAIVVAGVIIIIFVKNKNNN